MDIGKINDNYTFYEGYEGEPEIILSAANIETIHIWEGYIDDIYGTPSLDGMGWNGFTRDYHQMEGIFNDDVTETQIDPGEYLKDLMLYKNKIFDYEETTQVFILISNLFKLAINNGILVNVEKAYN